MEQKIIKKVDSMGRVTIPKLIRQLCNINYGDEVEIVYKDNNTVEIKVLSTLSNSQSVD